jgi:hypothetical protein
VMAGHRVTAVHVRRDTTGVTFHQGRQRWSSRVATAGAGYLAPGLVAVAGAALIAHQQTRAWLALLAGLGAVMVLGWVRNLFGIAVVGGLVLAVGWLLAQGTTGETVLAGALAACYLAIGGLRSAVEQCHVRGRGDAYELGLLLHVPEVVCRSGFVVVAGGLALACVGLLFRW